MTDDDTAVLPERERDDDLAEALAKAAPRRWWNRTTVVLSALLLLIGGFVGGLEAQKHWGGTPAPAAGGVRGTGFRGGYGFPGGDNPAATAPPGTTGTVKLVDGSTIYVQTPDGNLVTVKTDDRTVISAATKGKLSDVKAGETVTVRGAAGAEGTMTATSVTTEKK